MTLINISYLPPTLYEVTYNPYPIHINTHKNLEKNSYYVRREGRLNGHYSNNVMYSVNVNTIFIGYCAKVVCSDSMSKTINYILQLNLNKITIKEKETDVDFEFVTIKVHTR